MKLTLQAYVIYDKLKEDYTAPQFFQSDIDAFRWMFRTFTDVFREDFELYRIGKYLTHNCDFEKYSKPINITTELLSYVDTKIKKD
jgi:hypothetical protein